MERLVFVSGPMSGRVFELANPEVSVGREPTNRLQLVGDRCVSRRHARFVRKYGTLFVEDLGSKNGTFVNGDRISDSIALKPGDQVQITYHLMRVEWSPSAFGPVNTAAPAGDAVPLAPEPVIDRMWILGLIPSLILAPVGVVLFKMAGLQLVPFTLVLTGLALAFIGVIRFFKPTAGTSAFERAFVQAVSGSAIAILGALWLNAMR